MAREGTAYFSESGLMFATLAEAEKQDEIDKEERFVARVLEECGITRESFAFSLYRDSAQIVFDNREKFLKVMKEFDLIKTED